ncbi:hypothetical protein [Botrimarina hoheduenensis]|uniref:Autotransporter-associated beta strand repeat protein n=1 Tax=Botrimarina hoheduenensis TaxID=2528000 RepID=A0A5C5WC20_9BACT|nr:hypothetical protein [Botrimarina hoheduenensis]TWT47611.1 hypothetical protein Pla111_12260 [Botrimarina hoheduenensis]
MKRRWFLPTLLLVSLAVPFVGSVSAQPLDPFDFASLGTLNLSVGDYTIDTDTLTIFDNTAPGVPLFTGVVDNQNGQADTFGGAWDQVANPGQLGIPEIAVFAFDDIALQPTANITITGTRAIALLSRGDATIGTALSVDGSDGDQLNTIGLGGAGGAGGFAGGGLVEPAPSIFEGLAGHGPGGGAGTGAIAGSFEFTGPPGAGAFGGHGSAGSGGAPGGSAYGDLTDVLQGGSGGGGAGNVGFGRTGSGGGGAIELSASGILDIDADITARGGELFGPGSGGGIRLSASRIRLDASLLAHAGSTSSGAGTAGGGRVYLAGQVANDFIYTVGQPSDALGLADFSTINVASSSGSSAETGPEFFGVITLSPALTIVPSAQTLDLSKPIDASNPAESLNLFLVPLNVQVQRSGTIDIAEGVEIAPAQEITLAAADARVLSSTIATAILSNDGSISGTGRVETLFNNRDGGAVNAVNDTLTFTRHASAAGGSEINAINSTLAFEQGLNLAGDLNLINTTFEGDLVNNGSVSLAGVNTFTGAVSGTGTFTGTGTGAFAGTLAPGNSPGLVSFEGDFDLGPTGTLEIEIAGTTPGAEHDRVEVGGFATLEGALDVTLLDGFVPQLGDSFALLFASGAFDASFAAINLPDLSASGLAWELNPGGSTLFLEAVPALNGDFNLDGTVDAADYTVWRDGLGTMFTPGEYDVWSANFGATAPASSISVPEPTAGFLLIIAVTAGQQRRRN